MDQTLLRVKQQSIMGNVFGSEKDVDTFVRGLSRGPDLRVNVNMVKFCGLDSSENLKRHYDKRKMEFSDGAADWTKNLVEKLAGLASAPELAGLGALAVIILIDCVSFTSSEESIKEALRGVFAEEKASEVWDQIDECLKRYAIHIKNRKELIKDLKRMEVSLSAALTKLKNSMLRDGHMSSQALRAWVNGAAFHVQVLIQLARLEGTRTSDPIQRLLVTYQSDLGPLFTEHRKMVENKCEHTSMFIHHQTPPARYLVDEDSKRHRLQEGGSYRDYLEAYYNHRYIWQQREIQQHFKDVGQNLQKLVCQKGHLSVR